MALNERVLYQFPLSLYCEKTRWNLDAKGLDYICRDLLPGPHAFTAWRLAHQRSLPVLRDGQQIVGDSTKIALYLDHFYPVHPLLPSDSATAMQVLALEDWFDELGDHVRRYCWSMAINRPEVSDIFFGFAGYTRWQRTLADACRPLLRLMIRRTFDVFDPQIAHSEQRILDALHHLETLLQGNVNHYLVGNHFTLADLTAASMLAPLVGPDNSPWADARLPRLADQRRSELRASVAGQWVLRLYRDYRTEPYVKPKSERPISPNTPILGSLE